MVEIFLKICVVFLLRDEMILFETGAYSAISNKPFVSTIVSKVSPNEDEEFYQVHLDIFYEASEDNQIFSEDLG